MLHEKVRSRVRTEQESHIWLPVSRPVLCTRTARRPQAVYGVWVVPWFSRGHPCQPGPVRGIIRTGTRVMFEYDADP